MSRENVEILRRIGDAFAAGDLDAMSELLAPDFELHDRGVPEESVRRGPGALLENVAAVREVVPDIRYEPGELRIVDDRRLVLRQIARGQARTSGLTMESELGHVWTFADGRATRLDIYRHWEQALEAVGLGE